MKSDSGNIGENVVEHAGHSDVCGYVDGNYIGTLLFDIYVKNEDVFGHVSVGPTLLVAAEMVMSIVTMFFGHVGSS